MGCLCILILFLYALSSCNVTRNIPSGSYLLSDNDISISYPDDVKRDEKLEESSLYRYIPLAQTSNKKLFGGHFFLWVYNLSDTAKNNGFNRFLRRVGEAPVLLDTTYTPAIASELSLYMNANGFFDSEVQDTVRYRKKKAFVKYKISSGEPYIIDSVSYKFNDRSIEPVILYDTASSLIKSGGVLSRMDMDAERVRLAAALADYGYYQFSTANVRYNVDTIGMDNRANVEIVIGQTKLSGAEENNKIFRIRNIYINTNYTPVVGGVSPSSDTVTLGALNFIYPRGEQRNINPDVVARAVTLYPNILYSSREIGFTSANLSNLKYFKSVNILFNPVESDDKDSEFVSFVDDEGLVQEIPQGYMDCTILCSPIKKQSYQVDFETSTNSNYTDLSVTLGYGNKNIFKRAEQFNIDFTSAYDFMRTGDTRDSYQFGLGTSLTFPRLIAPNSINRYRMLRSTSSSIDMSYNVQRRPDYDRTLYNASFGYSWSASRYVSYGFKPINVSYIYVPWIDSSFVEELEETGNEYLLNSYESQMIFGSLFSVAYSTAASGSSNTYGVRLNLESSGNLLNAVMGSASDGTAKNFLGVPFSQYVRADVDFSSSFILDDRTDFSLAYRLYAGMGYPYGNSSTLPFERKFYAGGSSSMRGWQVRTLGPGSSALATSSSYANQNGNIRLETNLEGRFHLWGPINGAVFFDLGNVWSNESGASEDANFRLSTFASQLALNTGIGARLDFGYFIIRADWGIQLYDPSETSSDRWVVKQFDLSNTALHFGIGYPF